MATTVTSILRDGVTAAGVYPTLAAWRAALPANLVTADEIHILNVEAKAGGYTGVTLDTTGITTDATHYIKIQAAAGHRHAGVWDTNKALFVAPPGNATAFSMKTAYFYLDGIQVQHVGITNGTSAFVVGSAAVSNSTVVTGCIFKQQTSGGGGLGAVFAVYEDTAGRANLYLGSNLFLEAKNVDYPASSGTGGVALVYGHVFAYNNTFIDVGYAFDGGSSTYQFLLKNNLASGSQINGGRQDYRLAVGALATGSTNNASHDGSATGTAAKTGQTFTFVGSGDYHLSPSDTAALGYGADLSADATFTLTTDIDGNTYTAPWPIGADTVATASNTVALTAPATGRIYQSVSGVATISVTGTYTGALTALKARVVQHGTSTPVAGFDWATVVASPSGNAFSFTIPGVPKGTGWYSIQVQDTVDAGITITGEKVGVGELVGLAGQSNAGRFLKPGADSVSDLVRAYGNDEYGGATVGWRTLSGPGPAALGDALVTAYNCPVGIVNGHMDGTAIISWAGAGHPASAIFSAVGGKLAAIIFVQGEADWNGTNYATYLAGLGTTVTDGFRTPLGQASLPIFIAALGRYTAGSGSDTATYEQVKRAQYDYVGATANTYIVDRIDCTLADGLHLDGPGAAKLGARLAQAIKVHLGQATQYRGPSIAAVNKVNSTTFNAILSHRLGSDITPATEITGFRVTDPGAGGAAITVTSALRQSATVVQLVLASAPVGLPVISYATGATPVITAMARDNSALTLPVEWAEGVMAVEKTASVNLVNASNSAQASLTGLKWAWFDQTTPDAFTTPTDKGTGEITDGSGVLTVLIGNSGKTSGQAGWLIVTDSDGNPATVHKAFSGPVAVS